LNPQLEHPPEFNYHRSYEITMSSEFDVEQALQYIKNVKLAPISAEQAKAFVDARTVSNSDAFVNRGSIMYLKEIPEQSKTDALNWTLFGQLAADAQVNREDNPAGWYNHYASTLRSVGMNARQWNRSSVSGSQAGASVDATILLYLTPFLSVGARAALRGVIEAMKDAANEQPLTLFNSASSSPSDANFQVSDGTVDTFLNLTVHVGFMDFQTNQTIRNLLFFNWTNRNFTLNYASDEMILAKNMADLLRLAILQRIVDHIFGNIDGIKL
jgi:hypothetical protein